MSGVWCSHCISARGDHPHEASDEVNMLHGHVPFPSLSQSKLRPKGRPMLSQLASRSQGRSWSEQSHKGSHPTVNTPFPLPSLTNSSPCLSAGLNLEEPHVCRAEDKPLTPLRSWGEKKRGPEGMRCLLTLLSQDDALGFSSLFNIQDIRRSASWQS